MKNSLPTCSIVSKIGTSILVTPGGQISVLHKGKPLGAAAVAVEVDIWLSGIKTRYALAYNGVSLWLPFLATTHLEPIMRATDVYGISAPEQASSRSSLLLLDQRYSRTRGLNP